MCVFLLCEFLFQLCICFRKITVVVVVRYTSVLNYICTQNKIVQSQQKEKKTDFFAKKGMVFVFSFVIKIKTKNIPLSSKQLYAKTTTAAATSNKTHLQIQTKRQIVIVDEKYV